MIETALVIGGLGFWGKIMVDALIKKKYSVKVFDIKKENNYPNANVELIYGDIRDINKLNKACKNVDYVFHGAALQPFSKSSKKMLYEINAGGTQNILEACLLNKIKKVIYISSSACYGIPKKLPVNETTPFNPICEYGRSKVKAENICEQYREKGLNIIILRPRVLLGKGRLGYFKILFDRIAQNKTIYLIGKGNNLFQCTSVDDLVYLALLNIQKNYINEDFNIGTGEYSTIKKDIMSLIKYEKSRSRIFSLPALPVKIILQISSYFKISSFTPWHYKTIDKNYYFDNLKIREKFNWLPQKSNLAMLKEAYEAYIYKI